MNLIIMLLDIENFKNINDIFGHLEGDLVIKAVAECLKDSMRSTDFVGRHEG